KRDAVEPAAQVADIRRIRIGQLELATPGSRALHEELHGRVGARARGRQNGVFRRACERRQTMYVLAFDTQQLSARGQDMQLWRLLKKPFGQRRRRFDDMLTAVQNQQHSPVAQECRQAARGIVRSSRQSKRRCGDAGYESGVADLAEAEKVDLTGKFRE